MWVTGIRLREALSRRWAKIAKTAKSICARGECSHLLALQSQKAAQIEAGLCRNETRARERTAGVAGNAENLTPQRLSANFPAVWTESCLLQVTV
jgi:hypothetical protein